MTRTYFPIGLLVVAVAAVSLAWWRFAGKRSSPAAVSLLDTAETTISRGDSLFLGSGALARRTVVLPDSTQVILNPGTQVGLVSKSYTAHREVRLDGDAFFGVRGLHPLTVRTKNLVLTGRADFRVSAFAKDEGESVEVLSGTLRAEKAYTSPDHETDTLGGGDMVMINRSIDLMEKETYDTTELLTWKEGTLVFNNTPLDSVIHRVQDWFGVTIEVRGETGKTYRITGTFRDARLDDVMHVLAQVVPCGYSIRRYTVEIDLL